jgi:hypothetical protein
MSFWFNFGYIIVISPFRGKISTNELLSAWHILWVHEKSVLFFSWRIISPVLGSLTHHNRSVQLQIRHVPGYIQ